MRNALIFVYWSLALTAFFLRFGASETYSKSIHLDLANNDHRFGSPLPVEGIDCVWWFDSLLNAGTAPSLRGLEKL